MFCRKCGAENPDDSRFCEACGTPTVGGSSSPGASTSPSSGSGFGPLSVGAVVGGTYEITGRLGDGGMGTVYRASHSRLGHEVAIKVLAPNLARDPELIERFEQEAQLQANLKHPGIVAVHDFISDGDLCAFVMEYVEGRTLEEFVFNESGPVPLQRCVKIFTPLLEAMAFAHERGIVHRDIKPSNIMLATLGPSEVVKVMDFGIAKALGGAKRTAAGTRLGTIYYMSPEQCRGLGSIDHRADIYSLGVTLYEMATGKVPFDYESEYDLMTAHQQQEPPPPSSIYPAITPQLEAIIARAMAKDRDSRFQSALEFQQALESAAIAAGAYQGASSSPQPMYHIAGSSSPQPQQLVSSSPMPVSTSPVPQFSPTAVAPTTAAATPTPLPSRSSNLPAILVGVAGLCLLVGVGIALVFALTNRGSSHTSPVVSAPPASVPAASVNPPSYTPPSSRPANSYVPPPQPPPRPTPSPAVRPSPPPTTGPAWPPGGTHGRHDRGASRRMLLAGRRTLSQSGSHADAVRSFEEAFRLDSNNAWAACEAANSYNTLGRYREAQGAAAAAISSGGDHRLLGAAYYNMGRATEELGNHSQAIAHYEHSLRVRPGNGTVERRLRNLRGH